MIRTIVDVGSNSVLTLIAQRSGSNWEVLFESSKITGLGRGTKESGVLSEPSMAATLAALKDAKLNAERLGSKSWLAAATMAARIASNTNEFLERAEAQGTPVVVIPGEMEAELGFLSVAEDPLFQHENRLSLIDPGGNSTELVVGERTTSSWDVKFRQSFPIGALSLLSDILAEECPSSAAVFRASRAIDACLTEIPKDFLAGFVTTVGATGTNLTSIREKLPSYQPNRIHGQVLSFEEISSTMSALFALPVRERAKVIGIEPGREPTLPVGALILERLLFAINAEACCVSTRGWRYALLDREITTHDGVVTCSISGRE